MLEGNYAMPESEMQERVQKLNHILWTHDLCGTCCNVNEDMDDEYLPLAWRLAEQMTETWSLADLNALLENYIISPEEMGVPEERVQACLDELNALLKAG